MIEETVGSLAGIVAGRVIGDAAVVVRGVADLRAAGPDEVGFVAVPEYRDLALQSAAGAVLVSEDLGLSVPQIVVKEPQTAFARVAAHFHPAPRVEEHRVHPTAAVAEDAQLEAPVDIAAHATIAAGTRIGAGTAIGAGCAIGPGVRIGRSCTLHPRVVVYAGTEIGDGVVVHAGAVIGADGFGYVNEAGRWSKVPQLGRVRIGDDVEIGANTTIDRATLGETVIARGTKIDNLVHVGHNCRLGEDVIVAGFSAFAGSTIVGNRVAFGGHVITRGHQRIGDDVRIGGASVVHEDVLEPGDYVGYPLMPKGQWFRTLGVLQRLVDLARTVRRLSGRRDGA